ELYYAEGRTAEAEPLFQSALQILEATHGPDDSSAATVMNNLATVYDVQGRDRDAEALYVRAVEVLERTAGADDPHLATSLQNLALFYHAHGRLAEARPLYERALQMSTNRSRPDDPNTIALRERYQALQQEQRMTPGELFTRTPGTKPRSRATVTPT